jgi:hypothetical protein
LGNDSYYLRMGKGTDHPEVSGLNITGSGTGIAMGSNGISGCTDIGGNGGTLFFTARGIETLSGIYLPGAGYIHVGLDGAIGASGTITLREFADAYFTDGESVQFSVEAKGGTGTYLCTFKRGLLTDVTPVGAADAPTPIDPDT